MYAILEPGSRPSQEKEPCEQAIRERLRRGHRFLEDPAMKPGPFGYHQATSVPDAVRLLSCYEGTARVIAGGQSLMPMLNMRLIRPDALIDVNRVPGLAEIRTSGDTMALGALVRYTMIERSPLIAERLGLLAKMVRHVGDRQVRNRGTIGGSLAHGDPTAEMPLACLALGASVTVTGPSGSRELPVADLYQGPYATVLEPCEVLTEVRFPCPPRHFAFAEQCRRHNDFATVSVAAVGDRAPDGTWTAVRLALGGVADQPVLATGAGAVVSGSPLDDESIASAAEEALEVADPPSDVRASADYRRHLIPIYVRRVLTQLRSAGAS
jgi:aerobic carbon-monoxide dehydrogenase medium subunit